MTLYENELLSVAAPGISKQNVEVYKSVVSSSVPLAVCRQSGVVVARAMSKTSGSFQTALHCLTVVNDSGNQVLPDLVAGEKFLDKQAYVAEVMKLAQVATCHKTGFKDAVIYANVNGTEMASNPTMKQNAPGRVLGHTSHGVDAQCTVTDPGQSSESVFVLHDRPEKSCKGNSGSAALIAFPNNVSGYGVCFGIAQGHGVIGAIKAGVSPHLKLEPLGSERMSSLEGLTQQKQSALRAARWLIQVGAKSTELPPACS